VAWAQGRHLLSVVHIDTAQEASDAVEAGATGIEHVATMERLPESLIPAMLAHHTFADPTFGEYRVVLMLGRIPPDEIERRLQVKYALVRQLAAGGVPLTIGTDGPLVPLGTGYLDELDQFARAGFRRRS
jgi:imidazolonepropionase-like amidohydrolase